MKAVNFRYLEKKDIPTVIGFIDELNDAGGLSFLKTPSVDDLADIFLNDDKKGFCLVAELDDEVIGGAACFWHCSNYQGMPSIYLKDFYIEAPFRNKGIGKAFISELKEMAKAKGCSHIYWFVMDDNLEATPFYESVAGARQKWNTFRIEIND